MNKGLSIVLMSILCISLIVGCVNQGAPEKTSTANTIKIGSPNTIKAANFFDTNLGVFSKISNLTLTKMDENGKIVGNMAIKYEASSNDKIGSFILIQNYIGVTEKSNSGGC